jgi:hypothetical protein
MSSLFRTLQSEVADYLSTAPYLWGNGIQVLTPQMQDYDSITKVRLSKIGIACLVFIPEATSDSPDSSLYLDTVRLVVLCIEKRSLNRTPTVTAEELAEVAACWLQLYAGAGTHQALTFEGLDELLPQSEDERGYRQIAVKFVTKLGLSYTATATAAPTITQGGTTTSMAGPSGATVRYTTDGSNPTFDSTAYTVAITNPTPGTVITARAFKSGQAASPVTTHTVT